MLIYERKDEKPLQEMRFLIIQLTLKMFIYRDNFSKT